MEKRELEFKGQGNHLSRKYLHSRDSSPQSPANEDRAAISTSIVSKLYTALSIFLLFLTFFIAQFDKFILSYFQADVIASLSLTSVDYGILSGYATSIVFALCALPVAFIADYTSARVWTLTVAALWWSLCVLFQGLSHNFWQILCARIGMGIGQAPVEALSISLISDLVSSRWLFLSESLFYVSVYVGEAVSGQIATAFNKTNTPWNTALKAIGIVGIVLAVIVRVILREPPRRYSIINETASTDPLIFTPSFVPRASSTKIAIAKRQLRASISQVIRMRSFWLLTVTSGARQFSGNVFGWYMPSYLSAIYPDQPNLLSNYGIIVGTVGSVAVVLGGLICSTRPSPQSQARIGLSLTAIGGMISAPFVIVMVFSLKLGSENQPNGTRILYGSMAAAYITAELWLGAFASILALILPPKTKTFCLAIYTSSIILIYSSAPEMIGLSLRNYAVESEAYIQQTRKILAILIPVGYWVAGIGFLFAINKVKRDLQGDLVETGNVSWRRKSAFGAFMGVLGVLTIALFVVSLTVKGVQ